MKLTEADLKIAPEFKTQEQSRYSVLYTINNFYLYFPTVRMKKHDGEIRKAQKGFYQLRPNDSEQEKKNWKLPYNQQHHYEGDKHEWPTSGSDWVYSIKKGEQTPAQFYREINRAIKEIGFTKKQVSVAVTENICLANTPENFDRWAPILVKLYIKLREKGYTQRDITG